MNTELVAPVKRYRVRKRITRNGRDRYQIQKFDGWTDGRPSWRALRNFQWQDIALTECALLNETCGLAVDTGAEMGYKIRTPGKKL